MCILQVRAAYKSCCQLQTVTGLEMKMMDGNCSHLKTELRYLNDGLAPLTHSGVAGYSDQSLHNSSSQWPMLLMLQRLSIVIFSIC